MDIQEKKFTTEEYLKAVREIRTCTKSRLPIVLKLLKDAGFDIEEVVEVAKANDTDEGMVNAESLSNLLLKLTDECGYTYQAIADRAKTSKGKIWEYSRRNIVPREKTLNRIYKVAEKMLAEYQELVSASNGTREE